MWERQAFVSSLKIAFRTAGQPSRAPDMPLDPAAYYVRGSFYYSARLLYSLALSTNISAN